MIKREEILHIQVCDYLRYRYPKVIFRTDFAAGVKMSIGQAIRHKRLQSSKSYPDIFIAEPRNQKAGLYIELKAVNIYKKNGELLSNEHLLAQNDMINRLKAKGYEAYFAVGFHEAKTIIDNYLK